MRFFKACCLESFIRPAPSVLMGTLIGMLTAGHFSNDDYSAQMVGALMGALCGALAHYGARGCPKRNDEHDIEIGNTFN